MDDNVIVKNPFIFTQDKNTYRLQKLKSFPMRLLYYGFYSKQRRIIFEKKVKRGLSKHISKQWGDFIDMCNKDGISDFEFIPKKKLDTDKVIWQYWATGVESVSHEVVKMCFKSVDQYKGDYLVIRLDDNNISDYIDMPEFVAEKRKNPNFNVVFYSDLLRLALLNTYGGVWMDATILLTDKIRDDILSAELFAFCRDKNALNQDAFHQHNSDYFNFDMDSEVNFLNSFIVSKKNNIFIKDLLGNLLNFWRTQDNIPYYFFFQILVSQRLKSKYKDYVFFSIDDTLPHLLIMELEEDLDLRRFDAIKKKTNIHKLTYISQVKKNSLYEYLLNYYLE